MSDRESILSRIEEKIRTLGEQLNQANSEKSSLVEEINALKNKIAGLEQIVDESSNHQGQSNSDQIDTIKKELDKYINEVEHCIDMVKQI